MNERIKQLAEQGGLKWKAQPPHYTNTNNPIDFPVSANRDLEKFAELIIADIIKIVEPDEYHRAYPDNVMGSYGGLELLENKVSKIKKHFDVR